MLPPLEVQVCELVLAGSAHQASVALQLKLSVMMAVLRVCNCIEQIGIITDGLVYFLVSLMCCRCGAAPHQLPAARCSWCGERVRPGGNHQGDGHQGLRVRLRCGE